MITAFCQDHQCDPAEIIRIIELALSPPEQEALAAMTLPQIKSAVAKSWGKSDYKDLAKDSDWVSYHKNQGLNAQLRTTWEHYYREWVALPSDEKGLKGGYGVINGIDIFKNFRPWEVFGINRQTATKDDIQSAYKSLAKIYHPDTGKDGGDRKIFEKLTEMRDSLMIAF